MSASSPRGHGVGRGTTNRNARGSAATRRARKIWLLDTFGNGTVASCVECLNLVDFNSVTADRYPVPGCLGGTYARGNIRPMCGRCNSITGGQLGNSRKGAQPEIVSTGNKGL